MNTNAKKKRGTTSGDEMNLKMYTGAPGKLVQTPPLTFPTREGELNGELVLDEEGVDPPAATLGMS